MLTQDAIIRRLRQEAEEFKDSVASNPPSVGHGEFIEFPDEMRDEYDIGRFGYSEWDGLSLTYHAAPRRIHSAPLYDYDDSNFFDVAEAFADGRPIKYNVKDLMATVKDPVPRDPVKAKSQWEEQAFLSWFKSQGDICIVNPAPGTIGAAKLLDIHSYVYTSSIDSEVRADLKASIVGTNMRWIDNPDDCLCYLGRKFPPRFFRRSVWLIPDPFSSAQSVDQTVSSDGDFFHITKTVSEGDRSFVKYSYLEKYPKDHSLYPPNTISGVSTFWLASTSLLLLDPPDKNQSFVSHPALYFTGSDLPPWEDCHVPTEMGNLVRWRHRDGVIYDVDLGRYFGTYLSRRRLSLPPGFSWVVPVSMPCCLRVHIGDTNLSARMGFSMDGGYCIVSRDLSVLLGPIGVRTLDDHIVYSKSNSTSPTPGASSLSTLSGFLWRLPAREWLSFSSDGYYKHVSVTEWGENRSVPSDWIRHSSFYFRANPNGSKGVGWLPVGDYKRVLSFVIDGVSYIFDPGLPFGYLFPTAQDVAIMSLEVSSSLVIFDPNANVLRSEGCYDSYQVKTNRAHDYSIKALKNELPIMNFSDHACTTRELITYVPRLPNQHVVKKDIVHFLSLTADVYCWRSRGDDYEWVHEKALSVYLPGISSVPYDPLRLEARRLSEVLSHARHMRHTSWYYAGDMSELFPFFRLLERNGAAYWVRRRGAFLKKIKITWW